MRVIVLLTVITTVLGFDHRCMYRDDYSEVIQFPHPSDCQKFYKCNPNNSLSEITCPGNLEYNEALQICDYPRGLCKPAGRTAVEDCNGSPPGSFKRDPENCQNYLFCINGNWRIMSCGPDSKFNPKNPPCIIDNEGTCSGKNNTTTSLPLADCNGTPSGESKPDADYCYKYYTCINGGWKPESCDKNMLFDLDLLICIPDNGVCRETNSLKFQRKENGDKNNKTSIEGRANYKDCNGMPHGSYKKEPQYCNKYFICINGNWKPETCGPNQIFDAAKMHCIIDDGSCKPGGSNPKCNGETEGTFKADPGNCQKFFICVYGSWKSQSCRSGQMFDPNKKYCIRSDGTCNPSTNPPGMTCDGSPSGKLRPDPDYCYKYFICSNGNWKSEICGLSERFDQYELRCVQDNGICRSPLPSTNTPTDCDGQPHGTFRPDTDYCAKFFICLFGHWKPQSCQPGQMFSPEKKYCVKDNGNCNPVIPTTPSPTKDCNGQPAGSFKPDLQYCYRFFVCVDGNWRPQSCGPNEKFDQHKLRCIIDDGSCRSSVPTGAPPSTLPPKSCDGYPTGSLKADSIYCYKFFVCVDGNWRPQTCGPNERFDANSKRCILDDGSCRPIGPTNPPPTPTNPPSLNKCDGMPTGTLKPDPIYCYKFFVCVDGNWRPQTCGPNERFDANSKRCILDDGSCRPIGPTNPPSTPTNPPSLNKCDGMPTGTLKPDPIYCYKFFVCVDGNWRPQTCGPNERFDANSKRCILDDGSCRPIGPTNPPSTPTNPPPNKDCDGHAAGTRKPDPLYCYKFLVCINGEWWSQSCSSNEKFDEKYLRCVPDDGTCWHTSPTTATPPPPVKDCGGQPTGTRKPDPFYCYKFFVCIDGQWWSQSCGSNQKFDEKYLRCVPDDGTCWHTSPTTATPPPPVKDCDGQPTGTRKPDPFYCYKFFVCIDGQWWSQSCGSNQKFDEKYLRCVPDDGTCWHTSPTTATPPPPVKDCDGQPTGTRKPDPLNCYKFHVCIDGQWWSQSCDSNEKFDEISLRCIPDDGTCRPTTPTTVTPPPPVKDCDGHPTGTRKPDPFYCYKFFVCIDGKWWSQSCGSNEKFDENYLRCILDDGSCRYTSPTIPPTGSPPPPIKDCDGQPTGTRMPDPAYCYKFLVCVDSVWWSQSCAPHERFDEIALRCVLDDGTCRSTTSPPITTPPGIKQCDGQPTGTIKPDSFYCYKFFVCIDGDWRPQSCDPHQMFDQILLRCVPEDGSCRGTPPTGGPPTGGTPTAGTPTSGTPTPTNGPPSYRDCDGYPTGTIKPDQLYCYKFFICIDGDWRPQSCDPHQMFDKHLLRCVLEDGTCRGTPPTGGTPTGGTPTGGTPTAGTPTSGTPTPTSGPPSNRDCDGFPTGTLRPDQLYCYKFFVCIDGDWRPQSCGPYEMFDQHNLRCILEDGTCRGTPPTGGTPTGGPPTGGTPTAGTPTSGTPTPTNGPPSYRDCDGYPTGTIKPDQLYCYKFFICIDGDWRPQSCDPHQMFDKHLLRCVLEDGTCRGTPPTGGTPTGGPPTGGTPTAGTPTSGTPTPTSGPPSNRDCDGFPTGTLRPDQLYCYKFFVCIDGDWRPQSCGPYEMFDQHNLRCILEDGTCRGTPPTGGPPTGGPPTGGTPTAGTPTSGTPTPTSGPPSNRDCNGYPTGTIKPDQLYCYKFFICIDGDWRPQSCDPHQMFDKHLLRCVLEDGTCRGTPPTGGTPTGGTPTGGTPTSGTPTPTSGPPSYRDCDGFPTGTLRPDQLYCHKFFVCIDGDWRPQSCGPYEMFDQHNLRCILDDGTCRGTPPTGGTPTSGTPTGGTPTAGTPTSGTPTPTSGPPSYRDCDGFPTGTLRPDQLYCYKFFVCIDGDWRPQSCGPYEMFDQQNLRCILDDGTCRGTPPTGGTPTGGTPTGGTPTAGTPTGGTPTGGTPTGGTPPSNTDCDGHPQGTFIPDNKNCNKFFVCLSGTWTLYSCRPGQMFDPTLNHCVPDNTGICNPTQTTSTSSPPTNNPNNECDGHVEGTFRPDPKYCNKFYICLAGTWFSYSCRDGQMFNPTLNHCVPDDAGICNPSSPTPPSPSPPPFNCDGEATGSLKPDPFYCYKFFACIDGHWVPKSCGPNMRFDAILKRCVDDDGRCWSTATPTNTPGTTPAPKDCDGMPQGTIIADSDYCNKFFLCLYGNWLPQSCDPGYMFDKDQKRCVRDDGSCTSTVTPNPTPAPKDCDGTPQGTMEPDPNNCARFFICLFGNWRPQSCNPGQMFNPSMNHCVPNDGSCESTITPIPTPPAKDCDGSPQGTTKPYPEFCDKFFICLFGEWRPQSCNPGQMFDPKKNYCVPDNGICNPIVPTHPPVSENCDGQSQGTIRPDPNNCDKFFVCLSGNWIVHACKFGEMFDPSLKRCVPDNGQCHPTVTTPGPPTTSPPSIKTCDGFPEGSRRPDPAHCYKFFVCVDGNWRPLSCELNEKFDPITLRCIPDDGSCRPSITTTVTPPPPNKDCDGWPIGSLKPDSFYCYKFFVCVDGNWRSLSCGSDEKFEVLRCVPDDGSCRPSITTTVTPPPPIRDCDGRPTGSLKPDPIYCYKFFVCINGDWKPQSCKPTERFDTVTLRCIPDNGICRPTGTTTESPPPPIKDCDGRPTGSLKPDLNYCYKFFVCIDGNWRPQSCGVNERFDQVTLRCVPDNGICRPVSTTTMAPPPPLKDCDGRPTGSLKPDPIYCYKFFVCINGDWKPQSCGPTERFDTVTLRCIPDNGICRPTGTTTESPPPPIKDCDGRPTGSLKPDSIHCYKFFVCIDGTWQPQSCGVNERFDQVTLRCVPDNGICRPVSTTTMPPPPPVKDCDGRPTGSLKPDPIYCYKFFVCINGDWTPQSCGPTERFDTATLRCIPDNGICRPTGTTTESPPPPIKDCDGRPTGSLKPDSIYCYKFFVCINGNWRPQSCGINERFDQVTLRCVPDNGSCRPIISTTVPPPPKDCDGYPHGTFRPDSNNCFKFFICLWGDWKSYSCRQGQMYDPNLNHCVPDNGNCNPIVTTAPPPLSCDGQANGSLKPDSYNCDKYFICVNGKWLSESCSVNEMFDVHSLRCVPNDGTCRPSVSTTTLSPLCADECYGAYIPDPLDCSRFYICLNAIPLGHSCPTGQYFHPINRICDIDNGECKKTSAIIYNCIGRHGVRIPHESDCSRYYLCVTGEKVEQKCAFGRFFDIENNDCRIDYKKTCKSPRSDSIDITDCSDEQDGTYLKNIHDCSGFFVCANGSPIPKKCPPTYYFDDKSLYCRPNNGTCIVSTHLLDMDVSSMDCEGKHGEIFADKRNCENFKVCLYGKEKLDKCQKGKYFDSKLGHCKPNLGECVVATTFSNSETPINCVKKIDGYAFADQESCNKFFVCMGGIPVPEKCENGKFFDSILRYCRANDGSCDLNNGMPSIENSNVCKGKHGTYIEHNDCRKYYVCLNGQQIEKNCDNGQYFDNILNMCRIDISNKCYKKNITKNTESMDQNLPSCNGLPNGLFYPNHNDNCRSFFACVGGRPQVQSCPAGYAYNAVLERCDLPSLVKCTKVISARAQNQACIGSVDGMRYSNRRNGCKSFYTCSNGVGKETFCANGLLYNSILQACSLENDVKC